MATEEKQSEEVKQSATFKDWYKKNKEKLLEKRRAQYANDPDKREKARAAALAQRSSNPRASTAGQPLYKMVGDVRTRVYRIGDAAKKVGRKEQVLRLWENKGWVPPPQVDSSHRYYTTKQIELLREFALLIDQVRYKPASRTIAINTKSVEIWAKWGETNGNQSN